TQKPEVQWAEWRLAAALRTCGAVVKVVRLPGGPPGEGGEPGKIGLDDFLVAHGPAVFRGLMLGAGLPARPERAGEGGAVRLDTVEAKPVEWLWPLRIPYGAVTILDGDPGLGKSFITMDLAARLTRGDAMPNEVLIDPREPANVLLLNAEDDL